MNWYTEVLKKYAVFSGRASRTEYWYYILSHTLVSIGFSVVDEILNVSAFATIYSLAVLIPSIAAGVRRIHDGGRTGWLLLVPFYNLYLLIIDGDKGDNKYGPRPVVATNVKIETAESNKE